MPSKTPHTNGTDKPVNGINGTKDIEMKDDAPAPLKGGKGKKAKEGEEEMTVVVPPSKGSKLVATPTKDIDGDVAMESTEVIAGEDAEVKIDPVAKAVAGMLRPAASIPLLRDSDACKDWIMRYYCLIQCDAILAYNSAPSWASQFLRCR